MKIAVTGSSGYIGYHLVAAIKLAGHIPVLLSRQNAKLDPNWIYYDLDLEELCVPNDTDVIVHLAMNVGVSSESEAEREILAAQRMLSHAESISAKFIYVSSQTAAKDAKTYYGRTKWAIEQLVLSSQGYIVRPGLVYGGVASGLYLRLRQIVERLPVLPNFLPPPLVQPIHVGDLCEGILRISLGDADRKLFSLADSHAISFTHFLQSIARYSLKKKRLSLPIPRLLVNVLFRLFSKHPSVIQLNSLFNLPLMDTSDSLNDLELELRPLSIGMTAMRRPSRRKLLEEGVIFLHYLGMRKTSKLLARRYVKVVDTLRDGHALGFTGWPLRFPFLLFLMDTNSKTNNSCQQEFIWRLNVATSLAEACPAGAKRFLRMNSMNSWLVCCSVCARAVFKDICYRVVRLLAGALSSKLLLHHDK